MKSSIQGFFFSVILYLLFWSACMCYKHEFLKDFFLSTGQLQVGFLRQAPWCSPSLLLRSMVFLVFLVHASFKCMYECCAWVCLCMCVWVFSLRSMIFSKFWPLGLTQQPNPYHILTIGIALCTIYKGGVLAYEFAAFFFGWKYEFAAFSRHFYREICWTPEQQDESLKTWLNSLSLSL